MNRFTRIAASLLAVFGAHWLYALAIVPLVEPAAEAVTLPDPGPVGGDVIPGEKRHLRLLEQHFAPGDWELKDPLILESDRGMLLVKDYRPLDDGRVELIPCTMILLPRDQAIGDGAEAQPIIMRAPDGAILEFDEKFDTKRPRIGKLAGGELRGQITIRSRASRPGAGDDLYVVTRDVKLAEDRITTPHTVEFRRGSSYGGGRELEIVLAKRADSDGAKRSGLGVGAIQWIQLQREVKMHMQLGERGLLPGDPKAGQPARPPASQPNQKPDPPLEIKCQGPFRFDLAQNVATFSRQVDVVLLNPGGPQDQMNCELLSVYFAPRAAKDGQGQTSADKGAKPAAAKNDLPNLEPRIIEASGDPVIVNSPSTGSSARCQRLEYDLRSRRIVLEGTSDVLLHQGTNEIRTRRIDYQRGATGNLGQLEAAGPGILQGALADDPTQKYQARWSRELRVRPEQQFHLVSLFGAAQVRATDVGSLDGDEIHLWVSERPRAAAAPERPAIQPVAFVKGMPRVGVERLMAQQNVRIDSPRLVGNTGRLEVWFADASASSASKPALFPWAGGRSAPMDRRDNRSAPRAQQFHVGGSLVRIQAVRGSKPEASDIIVEGNARFGEARTPRPGERPLLVKGDKLHVAQANAPDARLTVAGKPAQVEARGLSLSGTKIELVRETNQLRVDGAGRMTLPVKQDPKDRGLLKTQTLEIAWQGGMRFDGQTAVYDRGVVLRGEPLLLRSGQLQVRLKRRIDFADPKLQENQGGQPEIEQIVCRDGFVLDYRSFDEKGQASLDHMEARELLLNRATGAIEGRGPGVLTTVRHAPPSDPLRNPNGGTPPKPGEPTLVYLKVQFEGPIRGNLDRKEVSLSEAVKAIYGPVNDWGQKLEGDDPAKLGPQVVLLSCDQLTVRTTPGVNAPRAGDAVELEALGHTFVEGSTFTARAHRITYAKQKDLLVLEGNNQADAQLFRQAQRGGPSPTISGRKFSYWPSTGSVEGTDGRGGFLNFPQPTGQPAPQPRGSKR